jgi:hypothetical protein
MGEPTARPRLLFGDNSRYRKLLSGNRGDEQLRLTLLQIDGGH